MDALIFFYLLLINTLLIHSRTWDPKYENENTFNEPYDHVDEIHSPNLLIYGDDYDWIGVSGTSLMNESYIAFAGTRKNNDSKLNPAYTKQSGIIVLCRSNLDSSGLGFKIVCKKLEEKHLHSSDAKYFGAAIRSIEYDKSLALIYCDPLWVKEHEPNGKCKFRIIKNFETVNEKEFEVCDLTDKCLGGFSVDLGYTDYNTKSNLKIIFGLPFKNTTMILNRAESHGINTGNLNGGTFFNFGYSVAFSGDKLAYASSPLSDGNSSFVKILNGESIYPSKAQRHGGFGTSIDTLKVGEILYGVVIGAPYQSKQNIPNVGAVFLSCKGHLTHMVSGEKKYDYFGYSVARLGDIDSDGSEEFVVSSPSIDFQKPGKIYIYGTSADCKISNLPLQIYQSKINGFGISISRGFDINDNGKPDFFVTSLGNQRPTLFKMPNQGNVVCKWLPLASHDKFLNITIELQSSTILNYDNYLYQVAIDLLNKGDPRFRIIGHKLYDNGKYRIQLQSLSDELYTNPKFIPLKVAIRGIRPCKTNNGEKCYESKVAHARWSNCENVYILPQIGCKKTVCFSDLNINVKPDSNGSTIHYGDQKNYQRTIDLIINNKGPDASFIVYLSIDSQPDLLITNIRCDTCKKQLTASGQNAKVVIDNTFALRDLKVSIDILYNELENGSSKTSINFNVTGVNGDNFIQNNNFTAFYSILFKPNLILSPKKSKEIIIDSRLKPPYLEKDKRISIQELGTELNFSYLIENKGPALKNVELKFYFPYTTKTNKYILYIMDRIRLSSSENWQISLPSITHKNGSVEYCKIEKRFLNPLHLIGMDYENSKSDGLKRSKRSLFEESGNKKDVTVNSLSSPNLHRTLIKCNESSKVLGFHVCGEVMCKLNVVPRKSEFTFNFRTWLFTKTFFEAHISDLSVIATLQSDFGDMPQGIKLDDNIRLVEPLSISQNVLFNQMKIPDDKPLPMWPIIVAIIIGILILVIIIVIAYYCGFFKRKRLRKERQKIREQALKNEYDDNAPLNKT